MKKNNESNRYHIPARRTGIVSIRNANDEYRIGDFRRKSDETDFGKTYIEPFQGGFGRSGYHCGDSVFFCYYCHGSWICKLRFDDFGTGSLDYYGCQHRNYYNRTANCT